MAPARAQPGKKAADSKSLVIAQIVDLFAGAAGCVQDFLIDSHAARKDINLKSGLKGRTIEHQTLETDGTPASLRVAIESIRNNACCIAVSGSVGDRIAAGAMSLLRSDNLHLAHVAPWLQNSSPKLHDNTLPIFAARQEQMGYALKTLSVMGMKELGAVYGTAGDYAALHIEVERIAAGMQLKLESFQGVTGLRARLKTDTANSARFAVRRRNACTGRIHARFGKAVPPALPGRTG
jgi:hypothetical protein